MNAAVAIVKTLRPRQWVKNAFVLAPLVFSNHLFYGAFALKAAMAAAAFCAVSGAVYAFNDLRDVELDRKHPVKKNRPIAAGHLSERGALFLAITLAGAALLATFFMLSWQVSAVLGGYLVNNLAYSLALKRFAFIDVLMIAIGFLLRVVAGGFAISVPLSTWLLACTALLSAMLGFGKRAHELLEADNVGRTADTTRVALMGYRIHHLRVVMLVLSVATCIAYALYTQDRHTVSFFGTRSLIWTLPFCIIGIFRFAQLALWRPKPISPTDAMLRDWPFLGNILLWGAAVLFIIYAS